MSQFKQKEEEAKKKPAYQPSGAGNRVSRSLDINRAKYGLFSTVTVCSDKKIN